MLRRSSACALFGMALLPLIVGQSCNPQTIANGLKPGLTGEGHGPTSNLSLELSPLQQDISDADIAVITADVANLPEASTDNDGIHGAAILRWTVVLETPPKNLLGVLKPITSALNVAPDGRIMDTDPSDGFGNIAQYDPILDEGGPVTIRVEVIRPTDRTIINEFGEPHFEHEDIGLISKQVVIQVNNKSRLSLSPGHTSLPAGGTVNIKAIFDKNQEPTPKLPRRFEWALSGLAGAGSISGDTPDSDNVTFTAGNEKTKFKISLRVVDTQPDGIEIINGPASAYVDVDPDLQTFLTFGYFLVGNREEDSPIYDPVAWVYWPKYQNALSYSLYITGITDFTHAYNETFGQTYTVKEDGSLTPFAYDRGGQYRIGLSGGGTDDWHEARFGGIRVQVTVVVKP